MTWPPSAEDTGALLRLVVDRWNGALQAAWDGAATTAGALVRQPEQQAEAKRRLDAMWTALFDTENGAYAHVGRVIAFERDAPAAAVSAFRADAARQHGGTPADYSSDALLQQLDTLRLPLFRDAAVAPAKVGVVPLIVAAGVGLFIIGSMAVGVGGLSWAWVEYVRAEKQRDKIAYLDRRAGQVEALLKAHPNLSADDLEKLLGSAELLAPENTDDDAWSFIPMAAGVGLALFTAVGVLSLVRR